MTYLQREFTLEYLQALKADKLAELVMSARFLLHMSSSGAKFLPEEKYPDVTERVEIDRRNLAVVELEAARRGIPMPT